MYSQKRQREKIRTKKRRYCACGTRIYVASYWNGHIISDSGHDLCSGCFQALCNRVRSFQLKATLQFLQRHL